MIRETLGCLAHALPDQGPDTPRVLSEETLQVAYDAWAKAKVDVVKRWNEANDPRALAPEVPKAMRDAAELVRSTPRPGWTQEQADALVEKLEEAYPERIQRQIPRGDALERRSSGAGGGHRGEGGRARPRAITATGASAADHLGGRPLRLLARTTRKVGGMGSRLAIQQTWGSLDVMCDRKARPSLLESESLRLTATIKADARGQFERTWVRNVVEEPLDEAGASARVELSE